MPSRQGENSYPERRTRGRPAQPYPRIPVTLENVAKALKRKGDEDDMDRSVTV
jgi:hypothetical protein